MREESKMKNKQTIVATAAAISIGLTGMGGVSSVFAAENTPTNYQLPTKLAIGEDDVYDEIHFTGNKEDLFGEHLDNQDQKEAYYFLTDNNILKQNNRVTALKSLNSANIEPKVLYTSGSLLHNNTGTPQKLLTIGKDITKTDTLTSTSSFEYTFEQSLEASVTAEGSAGGFAKVSGTVKDGIKNVFKKGNSTSTTHTDTDTIKIPSQNIDVPAFSKYEVKTTVDQVDASGTMSNVAEITFNKDSNNNTWNNFVDSRGNLTAYVVITGENSSHIYAHDDHLNNASPYDFFKYLQDQYNLLKDRFGSASAFHFVIDGSDPNIAQNRKRATGIINLEYVMKNIFIDDKTKKVYANQKDIPFTCSSGLNANTAVYDVTEGKNEKIKNVEVRTVN